MDDEIRLLRNADYRFAKSMPKIPHYYTLAGTWRDRETFERVVQYIRDHGVAERFYSKEFIYLYDDGWKYWTMGSPLRITKLINRARAE